LTILDTFIFLSSLLLQKNIKEVYGCTDEGPNGTLRDREEGWGEEEEMSGEDGRM
jgi:hypothetical protein